MDAANRARWRSPIVAIVVLSVGPSACGSGSAPCGGPGTICTVVGTGEPSEGPLVEGVDPLQASLFLPADVEFDAEGRLLVVDFNNNRVRRVDGDRIHTIIGSDELGQPEDGPATATAFNHPTHVALAPDGRLIVSTWLSSTVGAYDPATDRFETLVGDGVRRSCGDGGPASEASLSLPVATAFDSSGRLYIADQGSNTVRRLSEGGMLERVAGAPAPGGSEECCEWEPCGSPSVARPGFAGDDGPAREAYLHLNGGSPTSPGGKIAIAGDVLFIADTWNQRIRFVDLKAELDGDELSIHTFVGKGGQECVPEGDHRCLPLEGSFGGEGSSHLHHPVDIAPAPSGRLYIADTANHCVRVVYKD